MQLSRIDRSRVRNISSILRAEISRPPDLKAMLTRKFCRLLAALAIKAPWDLAFDNQLAYACKDKLFDLKCYSVEPMLFYHHKSPRSFKKESDIMTNDIKIEDANIREKGVTESGVQG